MSGPVQVGEPVTISGPVTVAGQVTVGGTAPQIDDVGTAPLNEPVALVRHADGLLRPDAAAIADRPTRTEVTDEVTVHALDPTPHPTYDDLPSLSTLFRNRLV